jgi:hypothetical protein
MMMRNAVAVAAIFAVSVAALAQDPRRDGRWEMTTTMEMAGVPQKMAPMTVTQCITKEQASDPQKLLQPPPQRGGQQSDCKMTDYKSSGNKITYSMKCTTPQEMTMQGEVTYGEGTMSAVMKSTLARGGQTMEMTTRTTGKRLGDCTQ